MIRLTGPELSALRTACLSRDNYHCQDCGRHVCDSPHSWVAMRAHMAHIVGRGAGGEDTLDNVRTLCGTCHLVGEHHPKSVRKL